MITRKRFAMEMPPYSAEKTVRVPVCRSGALSF